MKQTVLISLYNMQKIESKKSQIHGYGVFASTDMQENEIIELCPVIILSEQDTKKIDNTNLYNYYFGRQNNGSAIALGCGSLYNHSYEPNARYDKDFVNNKITFVAIRSIKKGEEITVNYNGDPDNTQRVRFDNEKDRLKTPIQSI